MAWTGPTAAFFVAVAVTLAGMVAWEYLRPGGAPRKGVLGLITTRGDRLFISLLGGAYIHLAYLALVGPELWWALAISALFAYCVFRWV